MTVFSLVPLRTPSDFADWYRPGADYVARVAEGMGFPTGDYPALVDEAETAMRANRTGENVAVEVARTITADLLADAVFGPPFLEWTPLWYEMALTAPTYYAGWQLRRVASAYAESLDHVSVPRFSRPRDVLYEGDPAIERVSGFADRFAFADAITHLEWFDYVATECGLPVPPELVARTREETVAYYVGEMAMDDLTPTVRRFQHLLFTDDVWVRDIDRRYDLDSTLFTLWERVLTRERERFDPRQ
ncbi:hypothetical protein [Halogeometricum limi]|uniref:DUF8116 domain-containing protein n=1 Tax=Halogeometricum limi TaxID=555875 RepID=A0A1I6G2F1_9EURY|nr:hypothetical protein [Halogeometricum limi]SFR36359.1 hypothetical protein SAMN04488124_0759 [Halogeometricum limi]